MEDVIEKSNPWRKPLIGGGVFALVVICVVAAFISRTDLSSASKEYEKNRADAEREGLYFSRDQIEARYAIPESENGANLISSVLPLLRSLKLDKSVGLTEKMVQDNWAKLEPAISKFEEASHRKHLMFKRDFSNPAATLFPEYSFVKSWVTLFMRMGDFAIAKNDFESAKKYWKLAAFLAVKQDEEGFLIGVLVRISCDAIIEKDIQTLISSRGKEPKVTEVLQEVLKTLDQPFDMKASLRIENWFATSAVEIVMSDPSYIQSTAGWTSVPNEVKFGRFLPDFKKANMSRIFRIYADAIHMIPNDPYDLVGTQRAYDSLDKAGLKQGLSYTMLSILPVFSQGALAMTNDVAKRNALIQAITLLKSGADPSLGLPLKDRHSMDIDGKPIRMKKDGSNWILYSIGRDKVDDGGTPMDLHGKGDYVIRIPK